MRYNKQYGLNIAVKHGTHQPSLRNHQQKAAGRNVEIETLLVQSIINHQKADNYSKGKSECH